GPAAPGSPAAAGTDPAARSARTAAGPRRSRSTCGTRRRCVAGRPDPPPPGTATSRSWCRGTPNADGPAPPRCSSAHSRARPGGANPPGRGRPPPTGSPPAALALRPRAGDEHQTELADLDLVAVAQRRRLDPLTVHVRTVERTDVAHGEHAPVTVELGVATGNRHVVEEDVTVRVPSAGRH